MNVSVLPDYTSERYSVLADLEQRADFIAVNELQTKPDSDRAQGDNTLSPLKIPSENQTCPVDFVCIYLLWDVRQDLGEVTVDLLLSKIKSVLSALNIQPSDCHRIFLSVEVIVSRSKASETADWEHCPARNAIARAFSTVAAVFGFGLVGFGVADDVSASVALNGMLQWLEQLGSGIPAVAGLMSYGSTVKIGNICVVDRAELLGFAKNRDPDASSGVFQVWITSKKPQELLAWSNQLIITSTRDFEALAKQVAVSVAYNPLMLVSLVVLLIAMGVYLYFNL